jgi:hypothetical protein
MFRARARHAAAKDRRHIARISIKRHRTNASSIRTK